LGERGEGVQAHERGGHHVLGEPGGERVAQRRGSKAASSMTT
jgi:hypothetical protein